MNNFKLGSHDTMTYLKPKKWYLLPFKFMAQCQNKTIQEQFETYQIRYFDLRVRYTKKGEIEFAHGLMSFKGDVVSVLEYLQSHNEEVWVRFLLEVNKSDDIAFQEDLFKRDCAIFEEKYTNLKFHNGRRKFDWKIVYEFKNPEPSIDQKVSSMTGGIWDDWYPYMYARCMNHENIQNGTDKEFMLLDFVHIQ